MPRFSDLDSLNKAITPKPNFEQIKLRCMQETNLGVPISEKFRREQLRLALALNQQQQHSPTSGQLRTQAGGLGGAP